MKKEELIHLHAEEDVIYLDDKALHHVEGVEIRSSVIDGIADLVIKMKVRYP